MDVRTVAWPDPEWVGSFMHSTARQIHGGDKAELIREAWVDNIGVLPGCLEINAARQN
jgi:hypothetical protein